MAVIIAREELYDRVWREPLRNLVKPFGLSEPTIRKRCREKFIPLPGSGYWAQLARGKAPKRPPLPARGPGMDEFVNMMPNPGGPAYRVLSDEDLMGPVPPPPVFDEPLDEIRDRYLAMIGTVKVARDLSHAHHKIRDLLAEDDDRREVQAKRGYASAYDGPKFDTPFEQRRLRVLNALMLVTTQAGGVLKIWSQDARSLGLQIHDERLHLRLDWPKRFETLDGYYCDPAPHNAPLRLALAKSFGARAPDARWDDDGEGNLEQKIGQIVAEFFVQAETAYRSFRTAENRYRGERKAQRIEAIHAQKEAAELAQRERDKKEKQERVDHLLLLAADHHRATTIRGLVASSSGSLPTSEELRKWQAWALGVADQLDPVSDGRLLKTRAISGYDKSTP